VNWASFATGFGVAFLAFCWGCYFGTRMLVQWERSYRAARELEIARFKLAMQGGSRPATAAEMQAWGEP